jgi:hypothetical protein
MMSTNNAALPQSSASDRQQVSQQPSTPLPTQGLRVPSNRKTIYDRHLNRSRNAESSRASFAYLFGEMVTYAQRRVTGIQDLEKRYAICSLKSPSKHTNTIQIKRTRIPPRPTPPRPSLLSLHVHLILSSNQLIYLFVPTKPPPTHHHPPSSHPRPAVAPPLPALSRCSRALRFTGYPQ